MQVQISSFDYNKFLKSPEGGKTLSEAEEYIQPTIDIRDFAYPQARTAVSIITEAGEVNNVGVFQSGAGTYRVRVIITGFIVANLAGENELNIGPQNSTSPEAVYVKAFNVSLAASQIYNLATIELEWETYADDQDRLTVDYSNNAVPTKVELEVVCMARRVK